MNLKDTEMLFKAIADKSRLRILKALIEKPQYLEELANRLNLSKSTVSFHLTKLVNSNLVGKTKEQYYTIFSIKKELFKRNLEDLMKFDFNEEKEQRIRIEKYKNKIWNRFTENNYIVQIPAQKQKRWIVFERILDEFDFGEEYNELEVNKIIKKFNDDYCLIRRTFIEERVMERKNSIYKLTESYRRFVKGGKSNSRKHSLRESYEQSIKDKFGVN